MNRPVPVVAGVCIDVLHARFLRLLPKIEGHARIFFRGLRCPVKREDKIQECVALAWKWFLGLAERGKDPFAFPMAFAALLARAVRCGRRARGAPVLNSYQFSGIFPAASGSPSRPLRPEPPRGAGVVVSSTTAPGRGWSRWRSSP